MLCIRSRTAILASWLALAAVVSNAGPVDAQDTSPTYPVVGRAELRDAEILVRCEREDDLYADCEVSAHGTLVALEDGVQARETWRTAERTLAEGESIRVDIGTLRELEVRRDFYTLLGHPPLGARHPWLGESWLQYNRSPDVRVAPLHGEGLELVGLRLESHGLEHVQATHDPDRPGEVRLRLRSPHGAPPDGPLAHGGPALTLGGALDGDTPTLGVGYELGLFDYLIGSVWFETDFESVREVLLVEAALPGGAVIFPSLAAGVGLSAQQAGDDDPQVACRIRLTASTLIIGVVTDFDYRPVTGEWIITVMGRASI
ncbi:MAG: hypothetical protein AB8I08_28455 [Sandaracinaceae bacterium]